MATNQLKYACEQAEKLPLKYQDMLAKQILETIEEMEWEEWLARADIAEMLDTSAEEAKAEYLAGKTIKYGNWSGQLEKRCEVFFLRVNDKTSGTTAANML
jgi:hypothetical protein